MTTHIHGCCADKAYGKGCVEEGTCMSLPPDRTCGDCAHAYRCVLFGFTPNRASASCSFFPRRFLQINVQQARAADDA